MGNIFVSDPTSTVTSSAYVDQDEIETLIGAFTIPDAWLPVGSQSYDDSPLGRAVLRASRMIDHYTRNRFTSVDAVMTLDGDGTTILSIMELTTWPLTSVSEVRVRASLADDFDVDGDLIAADTYRLSKSLRSIERVELGYLANREGTFEDDENDKIPVSLRSDSSYDIGWTVGRDNYRVTGKLGYLVTPDEIKMATVLMVREFIQPGYAASREAMKSETFPDGYSYTRATTPVSKPAGNTTGILVVDQLLDPFRFKMPIMAVGFV